MTWLPDPKAAYEERLSSARALVSRGHKQHLLISNLRLATAAAAAAVLLLSTVRHLMSAWWVALPAAVFGALVIVHAVTLRRNERYARVVRFYEGGIARIDDCWMGTGQGGARFASVDHGYARDLDLFGPASLFELLNTTRTEAGEETLADWLRAPAERAEILARQAAIAELGSRVAFREEIAVLAAEAHVARTGALADWAASPPVGLPVTASIVLGASAAASAALIVAGLEGAVNDGLVIIWLAVQGGIAFIWRRKVRTVLARIGTPARDLALLASLLERIEREAFGAARLAAIQADLHSRPSHRIATLQRFVSALDSMANQIFGPIAAALALRSQMAIAIDRWHRQSGPEVSRWLSAVGELEALASLATYAYEHPADPFPEIKSQDPSSGPPVPAFIARKLAHPLLPARSAVRNDVTLGADGPRLLIVSGSNMSGKSTLLRAVGVNVVLAMAGAPVRAAELTLSPLVVGATLRIEDSLQEGRSRFYAEILRIRGVLDLTRGLVPVLFLLDEILQGTNSYDRRIGAEAIVRSLVDRNAIGLVTTHDLALTELAATMSGRAVNVHFEDRLDGGTMVFDYRMRPGVVEHSNALALMRAVGLEV